MHTYEDIIELASVGLPAPPQIDHNIINKNTILSQNFQSALYEVLNLIEQKGKLETTTLEIRLALSNILQWLYQSPDFKDVDNKIGIIADCLSNFEGSSDISRAFLPTDSKGSITENIFSFVEGHLADEDYSKFMKGMEQFIVQGFKSKSAFSIASAHKIIDTFRKNLAKEIQSKEEMSFSFSADTKVKFSSWEIYRIFLNSMLPVALANFNLKDAIINMVSQRLLYETNILISAKVIDDFYNLMQSKSQILEKINSTLEVIKKAAEDEQEAHTQNLKEFIISLLDKIELHIYLEKYDSIHRNVNIIMTEPTEAQVSKLLHSITKEVHFNFYAVIKLLEFKNNTYFSKEDFAMYIREMNKIVVLLRNEKIAIPDDELRFFIDRILINTKSLSRFAQMANVFRTIVQDTERYKTIHDNFEECRMNKKHASALMSFYMAAMLEVDFSEQIPLPTIEEISNRIGLIYSITRRFDVAEFIGDVLLRGEVESESITDLQQKGIFLDRMMKIINRKDLEWALDHYLNLKLIYEDFPEDKPSEKPKYLEKLLSDVIDKIHEKITQNFKDVFVNNKDEIRETYRFAENKVVTLIGQELDRGRRDKIGKTVDREKLYEYIENYASDARAMYEAEVATKAISLADLYTEIQKYSRTISIVLGDVSNELDKVLHRLRIENFERAQIILGGIAMHHREGQLDFQRVGVRNLLEIMDDSPDDFDKLIRDSLNGVYGKIEVKDEMGKTREVNRKYFDDAITIIESIPKVELVQLFKNVVLNDLLKELFDAFTSSRNMAKNSRELKTALDDILNRSSDLIKLADERYGEMMGQLHGKKK
jgi:hypothetical protein